MLSNPCLSLCSQHVLAGSAIVDIARAGTQVAVVQQHGATMLFAEHDLGTPVSELATDASSSGLLACSPDGSALLMAGGAHLQRLPLPAGLNPSPEALELGEEQPGGSLSGITCQEEAGVFAAAQGR